MKALLTLVCALGVAGVPALPVGEVRVVRTAPIPAVQAARAAYLEERPAPRGFRPGLLDDALRGEPMHAPTDAALIEAFQLVHTQLAREGLLATLALVIEALGRETFAQDEGLARLASTGLPVDLLTCFAAPGGGSIVRHVVDRLATGVRAADLRTELLAVGFNWTPALPGFQVATESGEHAIGSLRAQIASGTYWLGEGDGSSPDIVRQLLRRMPGVPVCANIEEKHLVTFLETVKGMKLDAPERLTLYPEPLPVAQWAQDNGKPGIVGESGSQRVVVLVPRYATRGEDGATFVPGEMFALEAFARDGHSIAHSRLLFQGGNTLPVRDPKTGQRWLLLGEAEMHRNVTLGLTREQVLAAFRAEFGCDRCLVIPAFSFHIDTEVSLRAVGGELVAFVNDTGAASLLVVEAALDALARAKLMPAEAAAGLREGIRSGMPLPAINQVGQILGSISPVFGQYPESFAAHFALGAVDSGVGNLQRVLLALDWIGSQTIQEADARALERHAMSYLVSFRRRELERANLVAELTKQGFRVVGIPSTSEDRRGLNYLNGLQVEGTYYMPAYGGLFANLDREAEKAFSAAFGPGVEVVPILCGESQRRAGALHCAVSVLPQPR